MQRYAVVSDLDTPELRPIGLAVEHKDRVLLLWINDYGFRKEFSEPYTVREPGGGPDVVYHPGQPEYFDHVLVTLSRSVLVHESDAINELDSLGILRLFHQKVLSQQPRPARAEYAPSHPRFIWSARSTVPSHDRPWRGKRPLIRPAA